jgi:hypothetical protein
MSSGHRWRLLPDMEASCVYVKQMQTADEMFFQVGRFLWGQQLFTVQKVEYYKINF